MFIRWIFYFYLVIDASLMLAASSEVPLKQERESSSTQFSREEAQSRFLQQQAETRLRQTACGIKAVKPSLEEDWATLANGQLDLSTYEPYARPCAMEKVEDAKLILFNYELAKTLNLSIPDSPEELEALVLGLFAYQVKAPTADVSVGSDASPGKHFFATYYQDSGGIDPARDPLGDGRNVWTGQRVLETSGQYYYHDVVLKGVGKTGLEWKGHEEVSHKDGLQSLDEAIFSFFIGEINHRHDIKCPRDLAVIQLPDSMQKAEKDGHVVSTAISIRVGQQLRMGHLAYWASKVIASESDPEKASNIGYFTQLLQHAVKKTIRCELDRELSDTDYAAYFVAFASNLGKTAAILDHYHALHGSPTRGNLTTDGLFIDNGTWNYLDAHHGDFRFLQQSELYKNQADIIKDYITDLFTYIKIGNPKLFAQLIANPKTHKDTIDKIFDRAFALTRKKLILKKVGVFEVVDAAQVAATPEFDTLVKAHEELKEFSYPLACSIQGQTITPACFSMNQITTCMISFFEEAAATKSLAEVFAKVKSGDLTCEDADEVVSCLEAVLSTHLVEGCWWSKEEYAKLILETQLAIFSNKKLPKKASCLFNYMGELLNIFEVHIKGKGLSFGDWKQASAACGARKYRSCEKIRCEILREYNGKVQASESLLPHEAICQFQIELYEKLMFAPTFKYPSQEQ